MTVQDTAPQVTFVGTGAQLSFVFTFRVDDITWLSVDFLTDFDQFTLNANQDTSPGGSAVYLVAPPLAQELTVVRDTPNNQELDYNRYDPFDSESHEDALDKLTMQIQDAEFLFGAHIGDLDIHFSDAPADGIYYSRRNNAWEQPPFALPTDHLTLLNIGANTHAQIDAHIGDTTTHFGDALADGNQYARRNNAWEIVGIISDHTLLTNIGTVSHAGIDSHIGDLNIHFGDAPVDGNSYARRNNAWEIVAPGGVTDHLLLTNIGVNTHVQIDTHIADGTIHFTEGSVDHLNILNIGVNSHVAIDAFIIAATAQHIASAAHIADATIHFTEGSIDHGNIAGLADDDHVQYLLIDGTRAMTGGLDFATGGDAVINNQFLDGDIHFDVNNTAVGANKRAMTIIAEDPVQGSSSIDLRLSDTCYLSNFIFMQDNLQIVNTESGFASQVTLRLDNAVPATGIRTFGVFTTDPGFGSWTVTLGTGAFPNTMSFTGAFDTQFSIPSGQNFEFVGGPLVLTDTLSPASFNLIVNDTFTTGGGFNGGVIDSTGTITYDNGFFIWGLMVERKLYRANANPGFAAFTLFNALPVIENEGNFDLVSALVLNVGVAHSRRTVGTSTVQFTHGLAFSPQLRATVAGAVMTRSVGVSAVRVTPTFSTVAGSTVNLGTIRGMEFVQPSQALFQPGSGTENMIAYLGIDFPDMTFGGVNRTIEVVRSALNAATNTAFLNHTGTAESHFGGRVNLNGVLAHANANLGLFGAVPVAQQVAVPVTAAGVHAALVTYGLIT